VSPAARYNSTNAIPPAADSRYGRRSKRRSARSKKRSDSISSSAIRPNSAPHTSMIRMVFTWRVSAKGVCSDGNGGRTPQTRCARMPATSAGKITV